MNYDSRIFGFDLKQLDYSVENASYRLAQLLNDKVLIFNPYTVTDDELIKCAERGYWRPFPALTQMLVFHFHDIRTITDHHTFDAIFYRVGNSEKEYYFPVNSLINGATYRPTRRRLRNMIGKQRITNQSQIENIQNKSFFVSHGLPGYNKTLNNPRIIYQMHRLWGTRSNIARIIREAMIKSKITMLNELLEHPYCPEYLACPRYLITYEPIIRDLIADIQKYHCVQAVPATSKQ